MAKMPEPEYYKLAAVVPPVENWTHSERIALSLRLPYKVTLHSPIKTLRVHFTKGRWEEAEVEIVKCVAQAVLGESLVFTEKAETETLYIKRFTG